MSTIFSAKSIHAMEIDPKIKASFTNFNLRQICLPLAKICLFVARTSISDLSVNTLQEQILMSLVEQGNLFFISQLNLRIQVTCLVPFNIATYQVFTVELEITFFSRNLQMIIATRSRSVVQRTAVLSRPKQKLKKVNSPCFEAT